jgi:hypothetical protein
MLMARLKPAITATTGSAQPACRRNRLECRHIPTSNTLQQPSLQSLTPLGVLLRQMDLRPYHFWGDLELCRDRYQSTDNDDFIHHCEKSFKLALLECRKST